MSSLKKVGPGVRKATHGIDRGRESIRVPGRLWQAGIFQPLNHVLATDGKRLRAELIELSFRIAGGRGGALWS